MTAGREAFEAELSRDDWDFLQPATRQAWESRARGERPFIPTRSSAPVNGDETEQRVPVPAPEVPARPAEPDEIPRGATTVINNALKHGWDVQVTYARGPWITSKGLTLVKPGEIVEDDETEEVEDEATPTPAANKVPAIYESIAVRAGRGSARVAATWVRKPWTKDGAAGKHQAAGAHIWPAHNGGGLHNMKTLSAYLKTEE